MVLIFPVLCLWRRSLPSNLGGIDPEKLYRATLTYITWKFLQDAIRVNVIDLGFIFFGFTAQWGLNMH